MPILLSKGTTSRFYAIVNVVPAPLAPASTVCRSLSIFHWDLIEGFMSHTDFTYCENQRHSESNQSVSQNIYTCSLFFTQFILESIRLWSLTKQSRVISKLFKQMLYLSFRLKCKISCTFNSIPNGQSLRKEICRNCNVLFLRPKTIM